MIEYELYEETLPDELLKALIELEAQCFPGGASERLTREVEGKRGLLAIIAKRDGEHVGFKIGYERRRHQFTSWIGGVRPDCRGMGIARELMRRQHQRIKDLGYIAVRTQTTNEFKAMLILNLKCGFDVIGTFTTPSNHLTRIILEKKL